MSVNNGEEGVSWSTLTYSTILVAVEAKFLSMTVHYRSSGTRLRATLVAPAKTF